MAWQGAGKKRAFQVEMQGEFMDDQKTGKERRKRD